MEWGFVISEKRGIDLNKNSLDIANKVFADEPSLLTCIGCGGCTATCTAGALTNFNFRKLHTLLRRGEITTLKDDIKKCMLCGKCSIVCPRAINTRNVIMSIKKHINA